MDSAPLDELSIVAAAKHAGLSEFHFIRTFGEVVGKAPSEYIAERRLTEAKGFIESTDRPIGEIAQECGYLDASAFSRAFRRRFGESPSTLRSSKAL